MSHTSSHLESRTDHAFDNGDRNTWGHMESMNGHAFYSSGHLVICCKGNKILSRIADDCSKVSMIYVDYNESTTTSSYSKESKICSCSVQMNNEVNDFCPYDRESSWEIDEGGSGW